MSIEKMGENFYEKTILEDGNIHLHRLPKTYLEDKYNTPHVDSPDDIIRISYLCCGCEEEFDQNIPHQKGDATNEEVAGHFMKCGKCVDYKYIRRRDL